MLCPINIHLRNFSVAYKLCIMVPPQPRKQSVEPPTPFLTFSVCVSATAHTRIT